MQKALKGNLTHETQTKLPVLVNSQNMTEITRQLEEVENEYGFLIQGHGVYAYGHSLEEAHRHLEGIQFLVTILIFHFLL